MQRYDTEIFADRCALFFANPHRLREATIDSGTHSVQSEAYILGKSLGKGLQEIASDVLKNPRDYQDFFEGLRDHIPD